MFVFRGQQDDVAAVQDVENAAQDHAEKNKDSTCKEEVSSTTVFVNIRRGKGFGTKRKISDTARVTECDAKVCKHITYNIPPLTQTPYTNLTCSK